MLQSAFADPCLESASALAVSLSAVVMPYPVFVVLSALMEAFSPCWRIQTAITCPTCDRQGAIIHHTDLFLSVASEVPITMSSLKRCKDREMKQNYRIPPFKFSDYFDLFGLEAKYI